MTNGTVVIKNRVQLAAIGSAVGIGNIWRFAVVVGQNGGGVYLVPCLSACIFCALPLMTLEMAAGRVGSVDVVSVFFHLQRAAGTGSAGLSALLSFLSFVIT